jgi:hypothetical protein
MSTDRSHAEFFHIKFYAKLISVVGEYAAGHGFPLPNPVSIS